MIFFTSKPNKAQNYRSREKRLGFLRLGPNGGRRAVAGDGAGTGAGLPDSLACACPPSSAHRPVGWLSRVLQPGRRAAVLGSAIPRLYVQHDDAEPAATTRVVIRLRCYLPHDI